MDVAIAFVHANFAEIAGAALGITGALMLALKCRLSAWAWPIWVGSNIAWICYAIPLQAYGLIIQQAVFITINIVGAWQWLGNPIRKTAPVDPAHKES